MSDDKNPKAEDRPFADKNIPKTAPSSLSEPSASSNNESNTLPSNKDPLSISTLESKAPPTNLDQLAISESERKNRRPQGSFNISTTGSPAASASSSRCPQGSFNISTTGSPAASASSSRKEAPLSSPTAASASGLEDVPLSAGMNTPPYRSPPPYRRPILPVSGDSSLPAKYLKGEKSDDGDSSRSSSPSELYDTLAKVSGNTWSPGTKAHVKAYVTPLAKKIKNLGTVQEEVAKGKQEGVEGEHFSSSSLLGGGVFDSGVGPKVITRPHFSGNELSPRSRVNRKSPKDEKSKDSKLESPETDKGKDAKSGSTNVEKDTDSESTNVEKGPDSEFADREK